MSSNPSVVPVGLTFSPTDQEVIDYYLRLKLLGMDSEVDPYIAEVDILDFDPWELPAKSKLKSNNNEWWFSSRSFYRTSSSDRKGRKTETGSWKITGKRKKIGSVGEKAYLTFYKGGKTDWTMQEYSIPVHNNHLHQKYTNVICCLRLKTDNKGRKANKQKSAHVISHSKKKGRKANAPCCKEGETSGDNITPDLENPVASAVTPLVHGHDEVNHQQFSPMLLPGSSFIEHTLSLMLDYEMQVASGENGEVSGKTTSDLVLENPSASTDISPLVQCDDEVSCQLSSQIYSPDFSEKMLSSLLDNAIQAPSGIDGELSGQIFSDFAHMLGNEKLVPSGENGAISGQTSSDIENQLAHAVISPLLHCPDEASSQLFSPDSSFKGKTLSFISDNDMHVPSGAYGELSGISTSDLENPLASAVVSSSVQCDDDASCQLVSQIYSPDSSKQMLSSLLDYKIQAPSGTDGELSGQSSSDFDNQVAFVAHCDDEMNRHLSWPMYSPDVSNEYYVKFADPFVVDREENDNRTTTGLFSTYRTSSKRPYVYFDGQFMGEAHTEEVNERAKRCVYWPLDG
ncbi:protein SOMBRERO-like [Humulus lupulus]|uniref:protein SOMBRERO-like n=1 Tax=Humulus lupulus TaxID=3486 RepID=UPI002B417D3B|nr:protein SOMBRERO-like [Humulus lupulus]